MNEQLNWNNSVCPPFPNTRVGSQFFYQLILKLVTFFPRAWRQLGAVDPEGCPCNGGLPTGQRHPRHLPRGSGDSVGI